MEIFALITTLIAYTGPIEVGDWQDIETKTSVEQTFSSKEGCEQFLLDNYTFPDFYSVRKNYENNWVSMQESRMESGGSYYVWIRTCVSLNNLPSCIKMFMKRTVE